MFKNDKVAEFFDNLVDKYGFDVRALAYGSKQSQLKKFQALFDIGIKNGDSILDVGCGFGDLYYFIKNKGIDIKYWGIDISSKVVMLANQKFPDLKIIVGDILEARGENLYDYVLCTGFNCVKTGCNWANVKMAIKRMFELSRKGMALSSVSIYRTEKNPNTYYTSPEKLFRYCMGITNKVTMRHDYLPYDFVVYLYK